MPNNKTDCLTGIISSEVLNIVFSNYETEIAVWSKLLRKVFVIMKNCRDLSHKCTYFVCCTCPIGVLDILLLFNGKSESNIHANYIEYG